MKTLRPHPISVQRAGLGYTLIEVMLAVGIVATVFALSMSFFIMIYRTSANASRQVRVQRKSDLLVERLARGPFGGYGGIRGAYVNSSLAGNALPNPTGGTLNPVTNNTFQTLSYYAQTNFNTFVNLSQPVNSLAAFTALYSTNVALYTIGYNPTNRWVYYKLNNGAEKSIIDLEDIDLSYLKFSGGIFSTSIVPQYISTNYYSGSTNVYTNASNMIEMEFGMPYRTSDGRRVITNVFSAKVYIRNNF